MLATTKSHRATNERELINWGVGGEDMAVARLFAEVKRAKGNLQLEVALRGEGRTVIPQEGEAGSVRKRIRINGIVRRALDMVGMVNVAMFGPQDIELVAGAPMVRRRYLDILGSQVDSRYLRFLQHYNRVLLQRNYLLRLIKERRGEATQLEFWDKELVGAGSYLVVQRRRMIATLDNIARVVHEELTGGQEKLAMVYLPSVSREGEEQEAMVKRFHQALEEGREREIALGMTLVGPHRDDLRFLINKIDMAVYGSRGQQRTIALSLKLAEVKYLESETGDYPILLLDEVLSELDLERRRYLQRFIIPYEQVLVTTTDLDHFEPSFLAQSLKLRVRQGNIVAA